MRLFPATGHVDASQTHFESNRNVFAYAERGDPAPLFQQVHRQLPDTVFLQTLITRGRDVTLLCSVTGCHPERIPGARVCSRTAAPAPSGASAARSEATLPPGPGKPTLPPAARPLHATPAVPGPSVHAHWGPSSSVFTTKPARVGRRCHDAWILGVGLKNDLSQH